MLDHYRILLTFCGKHEMAVDIVDHFKQAESDK